MSCTLGMALGPFAALYDYLKGGVSTAVSSLILQKPNFIQFGELSDYVYCTYCASLYLERVAEDMWTDSGSGCEEGGGEEEVGDGKGEVEKAEYAPLDE